MSFYSILCHFIYIVLFIFIAFHCLIFIFLLLEKSAKEKAIQSSLLSLLSSAKETFKSIWTPEEMKSEKELLPSRPRSFLDLEPGGRQERKETLKETLPQHLDRVLKALGDAVDECDKLLVATAQEDCLYGIHVPLSFEDVGSLISYALLSDAWLFLALLKLESQGEGTESDGHEMGCPDGWPLPLGWPRLLPWLSTFSVVEADDTGHCRDEAGAAGAASRGGERDAAEAEAEGMEDVEDRRRRQRAATAQRSAGELGL